MKGVDSWTFYERMNGVPPLEKGAAPPSPAFLLLHHTAGGYDFKLS